MFKNCIYLGLPDINLALLEPVDGQNSVLLFKVSALTGRLSYLSFMIPVAVNYFDIFGSECVTSCQSTLISSSSLAAALIHEEVFTPYLQIGDCR